MLNFLRDPIWQFVGAFLALIAIGISIYLFVLQKNRKILSYQILAETALLTVDEKIRGKLKIVYEGVPVQNVHLVILKIINNGNIPIASADFEQALSFSFGERANILSAEIAKVFPKTLKPKLVVQANKIIIEPTLLNSQDNFIIKLLLAQYDGCIEPEARIIGVREVKKAVDRTLQLTTLPAAGGKPGKGKYQCKKCGQVVVLDDDTDALPPCPRCSGIGFEPWP